MRILIVEDDPAIAEPLAEGLERLGFAVDHVATGAEALAASGHDVVLLDLGLPDTDGTDVCRSLRARSRVPIIVISARSDEFDRVLALEIGADDYLVKPFGFRELVARIRAVVRRTEGAPGRPDAVEADGVRIDRRSHRVWKNGHEVALTPKEFDLLDLLVSEAGAVVTRERIFDEVWDPHWFGTSKTIDVHIAALRRKLGDPAVIETVRGVGFRLASDR